MSKLVGCLAGMILAGVYAQGFSQEAMSVAGTEGKAAEKPVTTIRTSARMVLLDVVVKGSRQEPVHGLKASDFAVEENGRPQVVSSFEEHSAVTLKDAVRLDEMPKQPEGIFTNYLPAPTNGAVNVVLLDALNTPKADQSVVRQQLLEFLNGLPPGSRVAIFGMNPTVIMLQGFTSDSEVLRNAILNYKTQGSPLLKDHTGPQLGLGAPNWAASALEEMARVNRSAELRFRAQYTLHGLNEIGRYLSVIPGRKNLIWFSASFPLQITPSTGGGFGNHFTDLVGSETEFRDTVDLLRRGRIAVYPIDARGLFSSTVFDGVTLPDSSLSHMGVLGVMQERDQFEADTAEQQMTMRDLANATGGHAYMNTNNLAAAVISAVESGANFYTLTYVPTDTDVDGKVRRIKVQTSMRGLSLEYRQAYYASMPEQKGDKAAVRPAGAPDGGDAAERVALMRGAPYPTEVLMRVGIVPLGSPADREEKVAPANHPSDKVHGPYCRYSVNFEINARDLTYVKAEDGKIRSDFDLMVIVYAPDGSRVNALETRDSVNGDLQQIRQLLADGIFASEEISVPVSGEYSIRAVVRDQKRNRFGAVEVAAAQVRNLPPTHPALQEPLR